MNYKKTVSVIPEMELSYSQEDVWNSQRTHIKLKADAQPFKVNWEYQKIVEFSVNWEREIAELTRLLSQELWSQQSLKEIYKEIKEFERLKTQSENEFNLFTRCILLDKSHTEEENINIAINYIKNMKNRLFDLHMKY